MKNLNINNQIKKIAFKNILYSTVLFFAVLFFLVIIPFQDNFSPLKLDSVWDYKESSKTSYVYTTVDELYYSGYNVSRTFNRDYGYYYTIKDDRCLFVLIPVSSTPEEIITDYLLFGHVVKTSEKDTFNDMLSYLATDLNWNEQGIGEVTCDYIISNADYYPLLYFILFIILICAMALTLYFFGMGIMHYKNPGTYPLCPRMDSKDTRRLITKAEKEISENTIFDSGDLHLTEHYFIEYNHNKVIVLPLMRIVWGYRMGTRKHNVEQEDARYNLFFTLTSGDVVTISNKSSEQTRLILEEIRKMNLGIILGYTDSKRKKVKEILKK